MSFSIKRTKSLVFTERLEEQLENKIVIFMVGLPARGKSYISKKLKHWLNWMGVHTQVFNVGNFRRQTLQGNQNADFFNIKDENNAIIRENLAISVLKDMIQWLKTSGSVAIHDATNSTKKRRKTLLDFMIDYPEIQVIFIESLCYDSKVINFNIELKAKSPDYINMPKEQAILDFKKRLTNYEESYEPLDEDSSDISFVKVIDVGRKVITNNIHGYLASQIIFYLMNIHVSQRNIYLVEHGESILSKLGEDSELTFRGELFSERLYEFIKNEISFSGRTLEVWTSTLIRAVQTAQKFRGFHKIVKTRNLNPQSVGCFAGLKLSQVVEKYPEEINSRKLDPLAYRFPGGGESYLDVIDRLKSLIVELERTPNDILIVSHKAVLQVIYAYFMDVALYRIPHIHIPSNSVLLLKPMPHGCEEQRVTLLNEESQTGFSINQTNVGHDSASTLGFDANATRPAEEGARIHLSVHYETRPGETLRVWIKTSGEESAKVPVMEWKEGHFWQLILLIPQNHEQDTIVEYKYFMLNEMTKQIRREEGENRKIILPPIEIPIQIEILDIWSSIEYHDYAKVPISNSNKNK
eukprot:TRINITY_DN3769_c1_g1_i1.p1 TRINITY_DN3769_c1_g1~~TRINITY_DN3769_c1_g1_i1.p1  ORF type:complete len:581 (-),score=225.68 TRINITY_DN3769_c1_g1_i1:36-1778(-)